jgi:uncharacterized membrane protein (UPF0136 family)
MCSLMLGLVRIYIFVFGVLTIAGGVMGFVKAKSTPSLIAGGSAGLLLLVAGYLMGTANVKAGLILAIALCTALEGRFIPAFVKTKKMMPAGMMAALSSIGFVLAILTFLQL